MLNQGFASMSDNEHPQRVVLVQWTPSVVRYGHIHTPG